MIKKKHFDTIRYIFLKNDIYFLLTKTKSQKKKGENYWKTGKLLNTGTYCMESPLFAVLSYKSKTWNK